MAIGFDDRKYNQIAHLKGYLKRFTDLRYDKNEERFWFADDPAIADRDFDETFKRDGVKHRIYKEELKEESTAVYGTPVCYLDKKPYRQLVASHIKPCVDCLRERREDIVPLANYFLAHFCQKYSKDKVFTPHTLEIFRAYLCPGNVRELRNVLEFCAYLTPSGVITELSLPENLRTGPTAQPSLTLAQRTRAFERAEILRLLERNGASLEGKKKTAAQLGISLASLYNKLNMQF